MPEQTCRQNSAPESLPTADGDAGIDHSLFAVFHGDTAPGVFDRNGKELRNAAPFSGMELSDAPLPAKRKRVSRK
jgi:hypothetical protein